MRPLLLSAGLLLGGPAAAQDPVDIGVIRDSDTLVVQDLLYPKAQHTEVTFSAAVMPFDPYTLTPSLQLGFAWHQTEALSFEAVLGGGYGFKSRLYRSLERDHGVAPNAFRYLASALAGVGWSPIYGKMNLGGTRIVHYDVYLTGRGGLTLEHALLPTGGTPLAPTLSVGLGSRFFLGDGATLRIELRDDVFLQHRRLTDTWALKQNVLVLVGLTMLSERGGD